MVDVVDLYKTCLFIQDNLDADLSLMFLAQTVGLSRFRFHRVFKAWRGETLHDFVTRLRMERAAFELSYPVPRSNRRSVKAIAFASGYKSLSSFSHAFSSYAKVSPRQFRYRMLHDRAQLTRRVHLASLAGARHPGMPAVPALTPFSVTLAQEPERELVVIDAAALGRKRGSSRQAAQAASTPLYGVESLPGLFARTQRRQAHGAHGPALACLAVEAAHADRFPMQPAPRGGVPRRARVTLKAGRYAVLEGIASIRTMYRVWRRNFDSWLAQTGECPRPEQVYVRFAAGVPETASQAVHVALYVPLEPLVERERGAAARAARTGSGLGAA